MAFNFAEFFVTIGAVVDFKQFKEFTQSLEKFPLEAAETIAAVVGIEYELGKLAAAAFSTSVSLSQFHDQTGLSTKTLQEWQIVAEQANISGEAVAQSVEALNSQLANIRLTGQGIKPFQLLGIGINQDAFAVLNQLRDRIKGLNPGTAVNLMREMGISPEMISLLSLSNQKWKEYGRTIGTLSEDQQHDILKTKLVFTQLGLVIKYTMFDIVSHFAQATSKSEHFKEILLGLGVVVAGLAAYFYPLTAAMIAFLIILDDLAVYFEGGDSLIGRAVKGLKDLATVDLGGITKWAESLGHAWEKMGMFAKIASPILAAPGLALAAPGIAGVAAYQAGGKIAQITNNFNTQITSTATARDLHEEFGRHQEKQVERANQQIKNGVKW